MMSLFRIKREEWVSSAMALAVLLSLHYLMISKFWCLFADYSEKNASIFSRNFHMSGFDYYTYSVVTDWSLAFDIFRHPLLAFMYYPIYLLNKLLWMVTGANCAQLLVGAILLFCGFYSFVFLRRTIRLMGVGKWTATLLSMLFLSFGYVAVSLIVPDHFCLSLLVLMIALYLSLWKMKGGGVFSVKESIVLLTLASGITLSNGVIVLLMVLFTNGRRFFERRFLCVGVIVPLMIMGLLAFGLNKAFSSSERNGSVIEQQMKWTKKGSNQRMAVLQQNFFGESLQLHRKNVLGDVVSGTRSLIVDYNWSFQYWVVIMLQVLMALGFIVGRRERFAWLLMSILAFNIVLHIVLAFAICEVYIMTAHWAFTVPLLMAYLFVSVKETSSLYIYNKVWTRMLAIFLLLITLYLIIYHGYLLHRYLTWPLRLK